MTHGRAQEQTVTIGGSRDGTVLAYRLEVLQDAGAYPRIGALLPIADHPDDAGPVRTSRGSSRSPRAWSPTPRRSAPTAAPGGRRRPPRIERAMDLFAAEIGMDPAEVRRRNLLPPFTEPHRTAFGALYDSGDYVAALDQVLDAAGYDDLRTEQAERRARGDVGPARHRPGQLRRDHRRRRRGRRRRRRTPPSRSTRTARATILTGTSPHGQGHATAWAMLASEELGIPVEKITAEVGRHRPDPRGRRHRRLAQPAAGRRGGAAGVRRS